MFGLVCVYIFPESHFICFSPEHLMFLVTTNDDFHLTWLTKKTKTNASFKTLPQPTVFTECPY